VPAPHSGSMMKPMPGRHSNETLAGGWQPASELA
jgi:hypothetical protein